jgi:hypothetical protein
MTVPVPATTSRPTDVGRGATIGSPGKYIISCILAYFYF